MPERRSFANGERFRRIQSTDPIPLYRFEVVFDDESYLRQLGRDAVREELITGFTIEQASTTYEWKGELREGVVYMLRTTLPQNRESDCRSLYELFYKRIGEKWEVPVIYLDKDLAANPDFAVWLGRKKDGKESLRVIDDYSTTPFTWTYVPNSSCINLWTIASVEQSSGDRIRGKQAHEATLVRKFSDNGIIKPEASRAIFHRELSYKRARRRLYQAIDNGRGLKNDDRKALKTGKDLLEIVLAEKDA